MPTQIQPFLMFQGEAEAAMNCYVSLFPDSQIIDISHYGPGQAGAAGSVQQARFRIGQQTIRCIDSPVKHNFTFTPASSLFVDCESEPEIQRLVTALSEGGSVLMPLNNYGFSQKFAWLTDRFGVSWQINWP